MEPIIPLDSNGQEFAEQISLERVGENEFKSANLPCPGGRRVIQGKSYVTTFGGHVYAQSAWAAAQTVPGGFVIHVSGRHVFPKGSPTLAKWKSR